MRKKFTLVCALVAILFTTVKAQVIFDPAIFPTENLPAGTSIVDIDGTKYLKAPLNGWSTSIVLAEDIVIQPGHSIATVMAKYVEGDVTTDWAMDNVNTFLKLANPRWGDVKAVGAASTADFSEYVISGIAAGDTVHALQYAGQERTGWTAIAEDTLLIGKVVVVDPSTILDPVTAHVDYLPAGWSRDTIDDVIYFRILLDGWNSSWQFSSTAGAFNVPADVFAVKTMAKYAVGTSGYALDGINTFLKFSDPSWTEVAANGAASSADFAKYAFAITPEAELGVFQVAGQETSGWSAVAGDTLWVGAFYSDMVTAISVSSEGDATTIETIAGTLQLTAAVTPEDAFNTAVTWASSDEGIATVSGSGLVTAVEDGDVTITATTADGSALSADFAITISNQHEGIEGNALGTLKMYPNPVENMLYIENADSGSSLMIYNMGGQLVRSVANLERNASIDVSELTDGIYIVRAYQDNEVKTMKLVK